MWRIVQQYQVHFIGQVLPFLTCSYHALLNSSMTRALGFLDFPSDHEEDEEIGWLQHHIMISSHWRQNSIGETQVLLVRVCEVWEVWSLEARSLTMAEDALATYPRSEIR